MFCIIVEFFYMQSPFVMHKVFFIICHIGSDYMYIALMEIYSRIILFQLYLDSSLLSFATHYHDMLCSDQRFFLSSLGSVNRTFPFSVLRTSFLSLSVFLVLFPYYSFFLLLFLPSPLSSLNKSTV